MSLYKITLSHFLFEDWLGLASIPTLLPIITSFTWKRAQKTDKLSRVFTLCVETGFPCFILSHFERDVFPAVLVLAISSLGFRDVHLGHNLVFEVAWRLTIVPLAPPRIRWKDVQIEVLSSHVIRLFKTATLIVCFVNCSGSNTRLRKRDFKPTLSIVVFEFSSVHFVSLLSQYERRRNANYFEDRDRHNSRYTSCSGYHLSAFKANMCTR